MVSVKFVIFRSRGGSEEIKGVRACMMVVVVVVNGQLVNGGVYFVFLLSQNIQCCVTNKGKAIDRDRKSMRWKGKNLRTFCSNPARIALAIVVPFVNYHAYAYRFSFY